jgi:hypothetical protein
MKITKGTVVQTPQGKGTIEYGVGSNMGMKYEYGVKLTSGVVKLFDESEVQKA